MTTPHRTRPNRLTIDLDAVRANVGAIRSANPGRTVIASLKADAYGHGALEVAAAATSAGAIGVAVGDLETAIAMRDCGLAGLLLVYAGPAYGRADLATVARQQIAVTAQDEPAIRRLLDAAAEPVDVFLEIDLGHQRLGTYPAEALAAAAEISRSDRLRLAGLLAHVFAGADASAGSVQWQLDRLTPILDALEDRGLLPEHLVAESTAALARGDAIRGDQRLTSVDPGRLVLGLGAEPGGPPVRRALFGLTTEIVQVKEVSRSAQQAETPPGIRDGMRIGILPIGRADGFDAIAVGEVLVAGQRAPILGIWIEHTTIDLSAVPAPEAGAEAVLLGRQGDEEVSTRSVVDAHPGMREVDIGLSVRPSVQRRYVMGDAWAEPSGDVQSRYDEVNRLLNARSPEPVGGGGDD